MSSFKIKNTLVDASSLLNGTNDLNGVGAVNTLSLPGGISAGNLTTGELTEASTTTLGLQLDNAGGTYNLIDSATTAAAAAAIQTALGLTAVGQGKVLKFFWLDSPGANVLLGPNASNVTTTLLGSANQNLFTAAIATSVTVNTAVVLVQVTNVTSGAETVLSTILQSGGKISSVYYCEESSWTVVSGTWDFSGGTCHVQIDSTSDQLMYLTDLSFSDFQLSVTTTFYSLFSGVTTIYFRAQSFPSYDISDGYSLIIDLAGGTTILSKYVNSVRTTIDDTSFNANFNDGIASIDIQVSGENITITIISDGETSTINATDGEFSSGGIGFGGSEIILQNWDIT